MVIEWTEEDDAYVVSLPDFGPLCRTHGATYEEAAHNGRQVLEMLIEAAAQTPQVATPP